MSNRKEILLSGDLSNLNFDEIKEIVPEFDVVEIKQKGLSPSEFIQLVFNELDPVVFTRDYILGGLISQSLKELKKLLNYIKGKGRKVSPLLIELQIIYADKVFILKIITTDVDFERTVVLINSSMVQVCDKALNGDLVIVRYNSSSDELIQEYSHDFLS